MLLTHHSILCNLHLFWANKPKCNQTICLVQAYYSVLQNLVVIIIIIIIMEFGDSVLICCSS